MAISTLRNLTLLLVVASMLRPANPKIEKLWPNIRDAIPSTQDLAVVASSILFVKTIVRQLQLMHEANMTSGFSS
jgi:hypothetical protein